jgi:hypothetical protein
MPHELSASRLPARAGWTKRLAGIAAFAILLQCGVEALTWTGSEGSKSFDSKPKQCNPTQR